MMIKLGKDLILYDISKLLSPVDEGEFKGCAITLNDYCNIIETKVLAEYCKEEGTYSFDDMMDILLYV